MTTEDKQIKKASDSSNLATILVLLSTIAAIFVALTANSKGPLNRIWPGSSTGTPDLAVTEAPALVEVGLHPTPESSLSPAVQTVDKYFIAINTAADSDDLENAWHLLTTNLKCNPNDRCNFVRYQSHWWQYKVQYKLYDCGSDEIDIELVYYARKAPGPSSSAQTELIRYGLTEVSGELKLDSAKSISEIGAACELAISVP